MAVSDFVQPGLRHGTSHLFCDECCTGDGCNCTLVPISDATLGMLRQIAKLKDCNVTAALEEAIREFDPEAARV